jgi:predicted aconitase with swiveling domain
MGKEYEPTQEPAMRGRQSGRGMAVLIRSCKNEAGMKGRIINGGMATAEAIVTDQVFGFWGGVDTNTGLIIDERHELCGKSIKGKVFVFPEGRGSTVGAAVILELVRCGNAPAAMINRKTEGILAAGAILAEKFYHVSIPVIDMFDEDPVTNIKTGDMVRVDGENGRIEIVTR